MRFPALLIACLFLLTAMSGCLDNTNDNGDDDDEPKGPAYIRLSDPRPLGSPSYGSWDIEVTVTSVTPEGIEAPWSDYSIKSGPKSGTSKDHWTIQPYTGETNWSGAYYKKTIGNSPYVEEGDVILVTGVSASATEGSIFMLDSFHSSWNWRYST